MPGLGATDRGGPAVRTLGDHLAAARPGALAVPTSSRGDGSPTLGAARFQLSTSLQQNQSGSSGSDARRSARGSEKAAHLLPLEQTLARATADEAEVLEQDELWSFMRCTHNKRWVWLALGRRTRQVVA